ncbi:RNA polymerase I-specific transcription initiation factor RRN3 isoform X2 [Drosophila biarmipes]|uniref:RNA polymerase I-specific transcription initiation factor RRN3 isoform X2 n=1 Tax=Drosophila biarmipes TaxID=125945 RepID=UPI001CDAB6F6|nr:RNA polymerase I-specific transcription initiation factor RRN3 isoform X2 [Drosophila biarmipes]
MDDTMSLHTSKTGLTSFFKKFSSEERYRATAVAVNKVRFSSPKERGLAESVRVALEEGNFHLLKEFTNFLRQAELNDDDFLVIVKDAKKIVYSLTPDFVHVIECLLSLNWKQRNSEIIQVYTEFYIDIMVTHNRYLPMGISKLIVHWIPDDLDESDWLNGCPSESTRLVLKPIHEVLNRILTAVPMAFDLVIDAISAKFPYFKKPAHVTAGYLFNVLWIIEYKPMFEELILQLVLQKLVVLDVNAPRDEIGSESDDEDDKMKAAPLFQKDDLSADSLAPTANTVKHPVGKTLDISLLMLYRFFDSKCRIHQNSNDQQRWTANRLFKMLLHIFDEVLLPSHNTHHVQFVLFYVTSIRFAYSESFLDLLWKKVQNPNISAIIRHTAVGYMASFLSRARFLPLRIVIYYLKELSKWAHNYIDDSGEYNQNCSLKAHLVFYSVCQAVFYLIAFRARDLTANSKGLLFLQSLQLSRLAMCHLNPLRYCLAPVATAFAGFTRTYQLAYCHTVLERNARRKLATVYGHDKCMPEETLESFFPFDPYLLKLSNKYIKANYMEYQCNDKDDYMDSSIDEHLSRKRAASEILEEDDFILADKRQNHLELSKCQQLDK